jgi:predicted DNA-binding transcriptional regulator AlpA
MVVADICKTLQVSRPTFYRWVAIQPQATTA